jgi:hypothetical protein
MERLMKLSPEVMKAAERAAAKYAIPTAAILAVIEVESAGKIYAVVNGRNEPLIRFEGHYFDRRVVKIAQARARLQGLASPKAGAVKNPASQAARWKLLERAAALDKQAAYESTSWGIGQVMGSHWKILGFKFVLELVETARRGVDGQLDLMMRYVEKTGLIPALQNQNWKAFARGYNGPAYAKNAYHIKLAEAFARWQKPASVRVHKPTIQERLPEPEQAPIPQERPEVPAIPGLDKPLPKSTTFWATIVSMISGVFAALASLDPMVQALLVVVIVGAGIWIIRERRRYGAMARKAGV